MLLRRGFLPKDNPTLDRHPRRHPRRRNARRSGAGPRRGRQPRLHLQRRQLRARRKPVEDDQSRRLRADGDRGQEGRREALRLLLVQLGLRRVATRRTSPKIIRWCRSRSTTSTRACASRCCSSTPATIFVGVIFRPATVCGYARASGSIFRSTSSPTTPSTKARSPFRRHADAAEPAHSGHCDAYKLLLKAPRREDRRTRSSTSASRTIRSCRSPELVKKVVEEEFPEKGEIDIVTTPSDDNRSYHVNSDKIEPRARLRAEAHDRGCRARPLPAFREGRLPEQLDDDWYYNVRTHEEAQGAQ